MMKAYRNTLLAAATAIAASLAPAAAHAQIQPVIFGTAEADTEDTRLFLLGASIQRNALGVTPFAGVTAYRLTIPTLPTGTMDINAVNPSVGLRYATPTSAIQASVGYLFVSGDDAPLGGAFGAPGGTREGVTTSALGEYWGERGLNLQGIANYNWGDEYAWARARGAIGVAPMGEGWLRLGAEVVGQGGGVDAGDRYSAWQAGPYVDAQVARPLRLLAGAGIKGDNLDRLNGKSTFPYFKVEFVLVP
jgi:hypothetical protein